MTRVNEGRHLLIKWSAEREVTLAQRRTQEEGLRTLRAQRRADAERSRRGHRGHLQTEAAASIAQLQAESETQRTHLATLVAQDKVKGRAIAEARDSMARAVAIAATKDDELKRTRTTLASVCQTTNMSELKTVSRFTWKR